MSLRLPGVRSKLWLALLILCMGAIFSVTLVPTSTQSAAAFFECLVCGQRGVADVILNVILFMPLGMLAALAFGVDRRVVLGGFLLSTGIEAAQFFIPGRDASSGDMLFNTVGTMLGVALIATRAHWLRPTPTGRRALAWTFALLVPALVALTASLLRPELPRSTWYITWNPDLGHLEVYAGEVLGSRVGDVIIDGTERASPARRDSLRAALLAGDEIIVHATSARRPAALAGLLTIYDQDRREMLLVGIDRNDLVLRYRQVSELFRVQKQDIRWPGILADHAIGDTLVLSVSRSAGNHCLAVNDVQRCGLGLDPSEMWALMVQLSRFPEWMIGLVRVGWTFALSAFVGFYARTRALTLLGAISLAVAFIGIPALDEYLLRTPWQAMVSGAAGFAAGRWLARLAERRRFAPPMAVHARGC